MHTDIKSVLYEAMKILKTPTQANHVAKIN